MKVAVLVVAVALLLASPVGTSTADVNYQGKPSLMMEKDKIVKNNANIFSSKRHDQAQDTTDYRVLLMLGIRIKWCRIMQKSSPPSMAFN